MSMWSQFSKGELFTLRLFSTTYISMFQEFSVQLRRILTQECVRQNLLLRQWSNLYNYRESLACSNYYNTQVAEAAALQFVTPVFFAVSPSLGFHFLDILTSSILKYFLIFFQYHSQPFQIYYTDSHFVRSFSMFLNLYIPGLLLRLLYYRYIFMIYVLRRVFLLGTIRSLTNKNFSEYLICRLSKSQRNISAYKKCTQYTLPHNYV